MELARSSGKSKELTGYCAVAPGHPFHGPYHDRQYGFPIRNDARLLERFALEINQAGLSWLTILKKAGSFRRAFDGFDPELVAAYGDRDRARLLADAGIIIIGSRSMPSSKTPNRFS